MEPKFIIDSANQTPHEKHNMSKLYSLLMSCPIPPEEFLRNIGLFINRQTLSRILFFLDIYKKILNTPGVIMEFGVRWGQNLALFESFRGMYEPFNFKRQIIGFDTFTGFETLDSKDGVTELHVQGAYSVTNKYEDYLEEILRTHESESPLSHIKKYSIIKGDASNTVKDYFIKNPSTIVSFAYFDLDVYKPTYDCLNIVKDHVTKGSIIGFDQLGDNVFQGETAAFREIFSLSKVKLIRDPNNPDPCYFVIE